LSSIALANTSCTIKDQVDQKANREYELIRTISCWSRGISAKRISVESEPGFGWKVKCQRQ
jgi:hypothetical protein